jgi:hypothetical protein
MKEVARRIFGHEEEEHLHCCAHESCRIVRINEWHYENNLQGCVSESVVQGESIERNYACGFFVFL